jgi:hypothetical protein
VTAIEPTELDYEPPVKKEMTLPELRKYDGQLFIMNNTPKYITFREKRGDKTVDFDLEPAGEPDSITFLPKEALDMRGLQKMWMRGDVTISTDPEMEDQIMLLNAQAVGLSERRMAEIMGKTTEAANHRDLEEKMCLVCGRKNPVSGVVERGRVLQSRRQVKEGSPPLCPEHIDSARNYVPRLVNVKGEDHWEFDPIQMTGPVR